MTQLLQFGFFKRNIFSPSASAELWSEVTHWLCLIHNAYMCRQAGMTMKKIIPVKKTQTVKTKGVYREEIIEVL